MAPGKNDDESSEEPPAKVPFGNLRAGVGYVAEKTVDVAVATPGVVKDVGVGTYQTARWTGKKSWVYGWWAGKKTYEGAKVVGGAVASGAQVVAEDVGLGDLSELMFGKEEPDDPNVLPPAFKKPYLDPHKVFGLDKEDCTTGMIRDAFRKLMVGQCGCFQGMPKSKFSNKQLLFAYHLLRKTIVGPAQKIMATWRTNPYLTDFEPEHILPTLRPLRGKFPCAPVYRGFRNLNIVFASFSRLPYPTYTFTVHYCMRISSVTKSYEECAVLYSELASELLTIPDFPQNTYVDKIYFSFEGRGEALAEFMRRVHKKVSSAGFFSPRLLEFLGIDFGRVQNEEEGAILALLDNPLPPKGTCWYMVDEQWLGKWRRFAMGRGPRRYLPPGRITNSDLKAKACAPGKKELKKGVDYRCVTFNAWRFLELTHGGGPCIPREDQDIYSKLVMSYLQGVVWAQTHARIKQAMTLRRQLYMQRLSKGQVAKAVIYTVKAEQINSDMLEILERGDKERGKEQLKKAANITRTMWRKKKAIIKEEQLERVKNDQEVFAKSRGADLHEPGEDGLVIRDIHPVIHIGSTTRYTVVVTEDVGFPKDVNKDGSGFKIKRVPGTEIAVIGDEVKSQLFLRRSKIVTINGYPASAMTYEGIKRRLGASAFPYTIEMERPLEEKQLPTLDDLWAMQDEALQYSAFKIMLRTGMRVMRWEKGSSYISQIRLSETDFFYCNEYDPKKSIDDLWQNFCLLEIKFVNEAKDVKEAGSAGAKGREEFFLSVVTEEVEVAFEIITDQDTIKDKMKEFDRLVEKTILAKAKKGNGATITKGPKAGAFSPFSPLSPFSPFSPFCFLS